MLSLSREKLRDLLLSAYESGWSGCLELKSEYVEQVMDGLEESCSFSGSSAITVAASPSQSISTSDSFYGFSGSATSLIPGYYSYFGDTSPDGTVFVNEPGDEAI